LMRRSSSSFRRITPALGLEMVAPALVVQTGVEQTWLS